jgi:hypothetical protein
MGMRQQEDAWLWWLMSITIFRKDVQGWNNDQYQKKND